MTPPAMALPPGLACRDCRHFARCEWLISREGAEVECDWSPSRFRYQPRNTPMERPTTLRELLAFLAEHPRVRSECPDRRVPPDPELRFRRVGGGGLWFDRPDGPDCYLPVDCGMTAAETGVSFRPDGFDVTKFGVTIHYFYMSEDVR